MQEPKIKMSNIQKVFSTTEMDTYALRGVDIEIFDRDYVSISGPSGCGKSSLLSILGLLDIPTDGRYLLEGQDVSRLSMNERAKVRNEKIGFIFQSFNLLDELSVYENVALPLRYRAGKLKESIIKERVDECLAQVELSHRLNHKPNQLSGGQQQRVAIARALVGHPAILLVDEPTGNLDSKNGDAVMALLADLNQKGTTICMVTHDPRYADMASRQLHLLDGQILDTVSIKEAI